MNLVSHFEIQADEPGRAINFYTSVFGWKIEKWDSEEMEYWMVMTDPKGGSGMGINGGLLKRQGSRPPEGMGANSFVCTVVVDDFDAAEKKILKEGGKVALPKFEITGMAWQGDFVDTEGNTFGIHEPFEHMKAAARAKRTAKQIFINLPVEDLKKTKEFFTKMDLTFRPEFTNENAACLVLGENIYAMLLVEKFFKSFIKKEISNAKKSTEVLLAIAVESREKVDELVKKAIAAGGSESRDPQDHGWMYARAIEDLDGHIWEIFFQDESKMPEEMKKKREG